MRRCWVGGSWLRLDLLFVSNFKRSLKNGQSRCSGLKLSLKVHPIFLLSLSPSLMLFWLNLTRGRWLTWLTMAHLTSQSEECCWWDDFDGDEVRKCPFIFLLLRRESSCSLYSPLCCWVLVSFCFFLFSFFCLFQFRRLKEDLHSCFPNWFLDVIDFLSLSFAL